MPTNYWTSCAQSIMHETSSIDFCLQSRSRAPFSADSDLLCKQREADGVCATRRCHRGFCALTGSMALPRVREDSTLHSLKRCCGPEPPVGLCSLALSHFRMFALSHPWSLCVPRTWLALLQGHPLLHCLGFSGFPDASLSILAI